jgi:hypothetical protein
MPSNPRIPPSASAMRRIFTPCPPRPYVFPLRSILQPASIPTPNSVQTRFKSESVTGKIKRIFNDWKGTSTSDHAVNRAKKEDVTDPQVESTSSGRQERAESEGLADRSKSQATTQRDLGQSSKKAKQEHPKAPEPVIGMGDERGEVS